MTNLAAMAAHRSVEIRRAIQQEVFWRAASPVSRVAKTFSITKQAVQHHIRSMVRDGVLEGVGQRRHRRYALRGLLQKHQNYVIGSGTAEDKVWKGFVQPLMHDVPMPDVSIAEYGITEMVNNVIDHSGAIGMTVSVALTSASLVLSVTDDGVGIFQKVAAALNLADPRLSLIELSKGKFTTDPARHTGEGIFFSSQCFDKFSIRSGNLRFYHSTRTDDWLYDTKDRTFKGTRIDMALLTPTERELSEVFARFSSGPEDYRFAKTHVPLDLATFGDESLVSRSSARRALARVQGFSEVLLDFRDVRSIGPAFADEIFRVFASAHPNTKLVYINANEPVTMMIRRAQSAGNQPAGTPPT